MLAALLCQAAAASSPLIEAPGLGDIEVTPRHVEAKWRVRPMVCIVETPPPTVCTFVPCSFPGPTRRTKKIKQELVRGILLASGPGVQSNSFLPAQQHQQHPSVSRLLSCFLVSWAACPVSTRTRHPIVQLQAYRKDGVVQIPGAFSLSPAESEGRCLGTQKVTQT